MYDAKTLLQRAEARKSERANYERQWRDIAEYVLPDRAPPGRSVIPGEERGLRVYDSTGVYAADNLMSGVYGMMTNPANDWFGLTTEDEALRRRQPVQEWLSHVNRSMLASFGPARSSFYGEAAAFYGDWAGFGNGVFYSEQRPDGRFLDVARPLSECFFSVNQFGEIDALDRVFQMPLRAVVEKFGAEMLPDQLKNALERTPDMPVDLVHATYPNEDVQEGRADRRAMPYLSTYVLVQGAVTLEEKGYWRFPYMPARWHVSAGEIYGRGPAHKALPDIKTINSMMRSMIKGGELRATPPILAAREDVFDALRIRAATTTYGAINGRGDRLVQPYDMGDNPQFAYELRDQVAEQIKDAFYFGVMQLVGRTGMTATEVMTRQEEKMRLMGPFLARIETEFLAPLIGRRFDMMTRAEMLPPAPPELEGAELIVEYQSPLAKAQKSAEAVATMRWLEASQGVLAIDPTAVDAIDGVATLRALMDGFGAHPGAMLGDDAIAARREAREQAQQLADGLAAGEQGAGIVEKLSRAVAAQGAPGGEAA